MKRLAILFSLTSLFFTTNSIAQNNRFSIDLNALKLVGDNYISNNYKSNIDIGVKYNFFNISKLDIGLSGNFAMVSKSGPDVNLLMIRPRISTEIKVWKISPYFGIGYSYYYFQNLVDSSIPSAEHVDNSRDGLNVNLGFKVYIIPKLYLNFGYDFVKLRAEGRYYISYNTNFPMLDFGIGYQF
jgi:opacity protein-like surface antigen